VTAARHHLLPLWFGLLGAPLAWTAQLWLGYAAADAACSAGTAGTVLDDTSDVSVLVVSALAAAVAVLAGLVAWREWRAARRDEDAPGHVRFMAAAGVGASALFLATIVLGAVPLLALQTCEGL
jgi:hypothetical protein